MLLTGSASAGVSDSPSGASAGFSASLCAYTIVSLSTDSLTSNPVSHAVSSFNWVTRPVMP